MPRLSNKSKAFLGTCDPKLIGIFTEVIKTYDFSVIFGHRGKEMQDKFFVDGTSQLPWPQSKHNTNPSRAIDVTPYPTMWEDIEKFLELATYVFAEASRQEVQLIWGGHWVNYTNRGYYDRDWAHWELHKDE